MPTIKDVALKAGVSATTVLLCNSSQDKLKDELSCETYKLY